MGFWKECSDCKKLKPLYFFYNNKATKDGLSYLCSDCAKERNLEYYHEKGKYEKKRKEKYKMFTDEEIKEWNLDGYRGPQYKTLKTEPNTGSKMHTIGTLIDHEDFVKLQKIKRECGLDNMAFILRTAVSALIKLYEAEKTFPEWKGLLLMKGEENKIKK
jgi:hypothetical protein